MADAGSNIEIRRPTHDDLPAIGELYRVVKGRRRPASVDRWRLFDSPWGDSPSLIAVDGDLLVAIFVVLPAALRVGDEIVLAGQGTDAATHPEYRRRPRLFVNLALTGKEYTRDLGYDVYYTFPNPRSIKLLKRIGGTYLGTVGAWGVDLERRTWSFRRRSSDHALGEPDGSDLAALIDAAHHEEGVIRVDKSPTWLEWRYSEATAERYEWVSVRDHSGALTAAALVGDRDPERWGADFAGLFRVHELFAVDEHAGERVLRGVVSHARRLGGRKVDVLVKEPVLERAVESAGFVRETDRPITTFAFHSNLPLDVYEFARWRLISGDMDFF
jgi:Acetyltransferase (GNAT) domain